MPNWLDWFTHSQTAIRSFIAKYEILLLHPSGHLFFSQRHTTFYSCIQTTIYFFTTKHNILETAPKRPFVFFTAKHNILQLYPKGHLFFYNETQHFEKCAQKTICFLLRNTELWKLYPNGHLYFPQGNAKSNYLSSIYFRILKSDSHI